MTDNIYYALAEQFDKPDITPAQQMMREKLISRAEIGESRDGQEVHAELDHASISQTIESVRAKEMAEEMLATLPEDFHTSITDAAVTASHSPEAAWESLVMIYVQIEGNNE